MTGTGGSGTGYATLNDRRIPVGAEHLCNGDVFTVTGRTGTGLTVQRLDGPETAELPFGYVAEHARHGWASTIASAQGATVDDALLLARPGMDRTNLYVGMTRGREANHLYLAPEPVTDTNAARASGRTATDPIARLRTMLDTLDDNSAAHSRLAGPRDVPPIEWRRQPGREGLQARGMAAVSRRVDGSPYRHVLDHAPPTRDIRFGRGR